MCVVVFLALCCCSESAWTRCLVSLIHAQGCDMQGATLHATKADLRVSSEGEGNDGSDNGGAEDGQTSGTGGGVRTVAVFNPSICCLDSVVDHEGAVRRLLVRGPGIAACLGGCGPVVPVLCIVITIESGLHAGGKVVFAVIISVVRADGFCVV